MNSNRNILIGMSLGAKAEMVNDMRDWIKDCQWGDIEDWQVDLMTDEELIRGIELHYDGGLNEFINANQY